MASKGHCSRPSSAAARLAAQGHYGQFRKREGANGRCEPDPDQPLPADCIPYITHLVGTMGILARVGAPDNVLAAALLHDYLEDVPDPDGRATILEATGPEVLDLVLSLTEDKRPDLDSSDTWTVRKTEQIHRMADMAEDAVMIKAADLLHNIHTLLVYTSATRTGERSGLGAAQRRARAAALVLLQRPRGGAPPPR